MIKKALMFLLIVAFPFFALFLKDEPGKAFVAIIMQATIIGWPFAVVWAFRVISNEDKLTEGEDDDE